MRESCLGGTTYLHPFTCILERPRRMILWFVHSTPSYSHLPVFTCTRYRATLGTNHRILCFLFMFHCCILMVTLWSTFFIYLRPKVAWKTSLVAITVGWTYMQKIAVYYVCVCRVWSVGSYTRGARAGTFSRTMVCARLGPRYRWPDRPTLNISYYKQTTHWHWAWSYIYGIRLDLACLLPRRWWNMGQVGGATSAAPAPGRPQPRARPGSPPRPPSLTRMQIYDPTDLPLGRCKLPFVVTQFGQSMTTVRKYRNPLWTTRQKQNSFCVTFLRRFLLLPLKSRQKTQSAIKTCLHRESNKTVPILQNTTVPINCIIIIRID